MKSDRQSARLRLVAIVAVSALVAQGGCASREPDLASSQGVRDGRGTTRSSEISEELQKRAQFTIENLGVIGATRCAKGWEIQRDTVKLLRNASTVSLQAPALGPSLYFTKSADEMMAVISWIEDEPSLKQVTVVNPRTAKEVMVRIPEEYLEKTAKRDADGVIYVYLATIPVAALDVASDDTLLIREKVRGRVEEVNCYYCVELSGR